MSDYDAAVVGAGPNGLAAAVELARSGRRTLLVEAAEEIGGGTRTEELTLPGFQHDVCSAIHPAGVASPFFAEIGLEIEWVQPPIPFSHPLDNGNSAALRRSVDETASSLGDDGPTYQRLMGPIVDDIEAFIDVALGPVTMIPDHPGAFTRIGVLGGMPAAVLAKRFETEEGKAIISGIAAHAIAPFHGLATSAVGLMLGAIGHSHGWPMARGGSQAITDALASRFESLGGTVELGRTVTSVDELACRHVVPRRDAACGDTDRRRPNQFRQGPPVVPVVAGPRCLQSRLGPGRADSVDRSHQLTKQQRSTWAAPTPRWPRQSEPLHAESTRNARSSSSPSSRCSTTVGHRTANTLRGATAMSPTARIWT